MDIAAELKAKLTWFVSIACGGVMVIAWLWPK